jgi:hypothetical protein
MDEPQHRIFESSSDGGLGSDLLKIPKLARVKKKDKIKTPQKTQNSEKPRKISQISGNSSSFDDSGGLVDSGSLGDSGSLVDSGSLGDSGPESASLGNSGGLTRLDSVESRSLQSGSLHSGSLVESGPDTSSRDSSFGIASFKPNLTDENEEFECETKIFLNTNFTKERLKSQNPHGGLDQISFRGSEHNVACDNNRKSIGTKKSEEDSTTIQQLENSSSRNRVVSLKLECVDRAVNPSVTRVIVNGGKKTKQKDRDRAYEYKSANENEFISAGYISANLNKKHDEKVLLERKSDTKHGGAAQSIQNSVKVTNCVSKDRNIDKALSTNITARMQPKKKPTNLSQFSENKEKQQLLLLWCAKSCASDRDKLTTQITDEGAEQSRGNAPYNNTRSVLGFGSRIKLDKNSNNGITSRSSRQQQRRHLTNHHITNHKWNSSWQLTDANRKKVLNQKRTISELNLTSLCPLENARTREQLLIDKTRSSV